MVTISAVMALRQDVLVRSIVSMGLGACGFEDGKV